MSEVSDILAATGGPSARAAAINAAELRNVKAGATQNEPIASVHYVNEPLAGLVVTQYLNSNDEVISQTPPRAVVAYLQDGLTASGFQPEGERAARKDKTV